MATNPILGSLTIPTGDVNRAGAALYALVQLAALPDLSSTETPIASAAAAIIGPIGAIIVTIGALMSMAGTNSGTMFEGSRMLYALSLGRRMGPISYVHPQLRTPTVAIGIHATVALVLAGSFAQLALVSALARVTTYLVTSAAVPRLRKLNEGFRTPGLVVPILGVLVSLAFLYGRNRWHFIAAAIALVVRAVIYAVSHPAKAR